MDDGPTNLGGPPVGDACFPHASWSSTAAKVVHAATAGATAPLTMRSRASTKSGTSSMCGQLAAQRTALTVTDQLLGMRVRPTLKVDLVLS